MSNQKDKQNKLIIYKNTYIKENHLKCTHRDLLDALKSRDQEQYKKCISNHLLAYEKYVEVFKRHCN